MKRRRKGKHAAIIIYSCYYNSNFAFKFRRFEVEFINITVNLRKFVDKTLLVIGIYK